MSNLLKSGFVTFREEEKRIINSNERVAKRLEELNIRQESFKAASLGETDEEGVMDSETEDALLGEESGNIYREKPEYDGPTPEELLEQARQEIEEMKQAARQEIEEEKQRALEEARSRGQEAGYQQGYEEAMQEAKRAEQETQELRRQLQSEYEEKMEELEPMFVDELTEIYEHVFQAGLREERGILLHLLDTALHNIDSGREFLIKVSKEDWEYVTERKNELLAGMPGATLEVVKDVTMKQGEGLIETGGGIFDCGIEVELQALKKRLRMLAYEHKGDSAE